MKLEHIAFNVADPIAMSNWYVEHLGLTIVRSSTTAPYAHFLADDSGNVMIELYCNPPETVPDYAKMDTLVLHLAFVSEDPTADRARLESEGATFINDVNAPDGSYLVMMRDPWGLALQLCRRANSMLKDF